MSGVERGPALLSVSHPAFLWLTSVAGGGAPPPAAAGGLAGGPCSAAAGRGRFELGLETNVSHSTDLYVRHPDSDLWGANKVLLKTGPPASVSASGNLRKTGITIHSRRMKYALD